MDKKIQSKIWQCLPKEARNHIRSDYEYYLKRYKTVNANTSKGAIDVLEDLFGHHNLTSDTEPSELVFIQRAKLQEMFEVGDRSSCSTLAALFGDKCLPDKEPSVQVEPKFKVGDIVRVKYPKFCKGEIGIIDEIGSRILEYHLKGNKTLENDYFAEDMLEHYTEPETKDNTQQNSWDEDFKRMNELFDKMKKSLASFYDSYGKMCVAVDKLKRL